MRSPAKHIASMPSLSLLCTLFGSIAAVVFALTMLCLPSAPSDSVNPVTRGAISGTGALLFGGMGMLLVLSGSCREIVADAAGLRWRLFPWIGAWKTVRWKEIVDFYLQDQQTRWSVQTEQGALSFTQRDRTNFTALTDFIAKRAVRAPCREWKERGFRPGERRQIVFQYGSEEAVLMLGSAILIALPTLFFTVVSAIGVLHRIREQGWNGGIGLELLFGIGIFVLFAGGSAVMARAGWKNLGRSDRIAVEEHRIAWIRKEGTVELKWSQIHSAYSQGMRGILETSTARIEYAAMIQDAPLLQRLIRQFAAEAFARGQKEHPGISMLVGAPEIRQGETVFVYRTKLNFIGACIPTFFAFLFLVVSAQETVRRWWPGWDARFTRNTPAELALCGVIAACMALFSLWLWQRLFWSKIVVNEDTITHYGLFGVRSMQWRDIQAVTSWKPNPAFRFYILQGPETRIAIWTGISDVRKLESEINSRLPDALPKFRLLPPACYEDLP